MTNVKWLLCFGIVCGFSAAGFAGQNPMLEDVRQVYVTIDRSGIEPNEPPIDWASLQSQIENKIKGAGIKVTTEKATQIKSYAVENMPAELRITLMMIAMPETEQFVFHSETSVNRFVSLAGKTDVRFSSPVWRSSIIMQSSDAANVNDETAKAIIKQIDEFISAQKTAKTNSFGEANEPHKKPKVAPKAEQKAVSENQETYIASKNGKVFHLAKCASVKSISPVNVVTFATRDEATASGRKPCKKCNP